MGLFVWAEGSARTAGDGGIVSLLGVGRWPIFYIPEGAADRQEIGVTQ